MKTLLLAIMSVGLLISMSCNQNTRVSSSFKLKQIQSSDQDFFPKEPVVLNPEIEQLVMASSRPRDLFEVIAVIKLEEKPETLIADISDAVLHDDRVFIMDLTQNQVTCFNLEGNFLFHVGKMGQGPGEYSNLASIQKSEKHLIIADNHARFHFYSFDGVHAYSTPTALNQSILPGGEFWFEDGRLFVLNVDTFDPDLPAHAIVDFKSDGFEVVGGFGRRFSLAEQLRVRYFHSAVEMVGKNLWIGSPYHSEIDIFNFSGQKLTTINRSSKSYHRLKIEYFEGVSNKQEFFSKKSEFQSTSSIHSLEPFVLVCYGSEIDLYDYNGNFIKHLDKDKRMPNILHSYQGKLLTWMPWFVIKDHFADVLSEDYPEMKVTEDDNPYLVLYQLKVSYE